MKQILAMVPFPLKLSLLKSGTWWKLSTPRGRVRSVVAVGREMVLIRRGWREGERQTSCRMDMAHFQDNIQCHTHHCSPIPMEWFQYSPIPVHHLILTSILSPTTAMSILAHLINKPHPLTPPTTIPAHPSPNLRLTDPNILHKITWLP